MNMLMDLSRESRLSSTFKKDYDEEIRKQILTLSLEDSGYNSGFHDSDPQHTKRSLQELLQTQNNFFFTSILPECHISRQPKTDILGLLGSNGNYPHILEKILSQLEPDDLVRCCLVSKSWKTVFENDSQATQRRKAYLSSMGLKNKENLRLPDDCERTIQQLPPRIFTSTPLAPLAAARQNNFSASSVTLSGKLVRASAVPIMDRFSIFVEEGKKHDKIQAPCPRCSLPAKINLDITLGQCTQSICRFQYCLLCRCEQHLNTSCPLLQSKGRGSKWPKSLASRKCKRRLQRL